MFVLKHLEESALLQGQSKVQSFFKHPTSISEMYIILTVRREKFVPNYLGKYASKKR